MTSQYDRTCSSTDEWSFLNYHKETLKRPDPAWHFDRDELRAVAMIYFKLSLEESRDYKQELSRTRFREVLHSAFGMADDTLIGGMFRALGIINNVSLKSWISAISIFLRGSLKQQIKFCFKVYDRAAKNQIRREQMISLMKLQQFVHMLQDEAVDEAINDLADIMIKKMDVDKDGIVSFEDYSNSVQMDPMLLECLGPCIPNRAHVHSFLTTFTDKIKGF